MNHTTVHWSLAFVATFFLFLGELSGQSTTKIISVPFSLDGENGAELALDQMDTWEITEAAARISIRLRPEEPMPAWDRCDSLTLTLRTGGTAELVGTLHIQGRRAQLMFPVKLTAGFAGKLTFPLQEFPLTAGTTHPKKIFLSLVKSEGARLSITALELQPHVGDRSPLRDRYGQRMLADWPGKVTQDQQLRRAAEEEWSALADMPGPEGRSRYGGWTDGPRYEATGFFRVEALGATKDSLQGWTLVDPDGYPFWSLGVTGLRHKIPSTDVTLWAGRADLFDSLPPLTGPYADAYEEQDFVSFYTWNILRKWGSLARWREVSFKRLQKWGMNTLGNWAHASVLAETPLPYTRAIRTNRGHAPLLGTSHTPDVFDPQWEAHLDTLFALTINWKDDPRLLGYFVDNEMGWGGLKLLARADSNDYLRTEWRNQVQGAFAYLNLLNQSWGTDFSTWEEVAQMRQGPDSVEAFQQMYLHLEAHFAETYFRLIATKLKQQDPNHLNLGCRFTRKLKPDYVVSAAGRYVDILSVNVYSYAPIEADMNAWHRLSGGKPMLIGEHHVSLKSPRQLSPNFQDFTAEERYDYYVNYLKTWSQRPYSVGCHWYQYKDQPLTGRGRNGDGERRVVGLVDITDQPHEELVKAIRLVAGELYGWKF